MDKKIASKLIADYLEAAEHALRNAVRVADMSGVAFDLPWGGEGTEESGIGAKYVPAGSEEANYYDREGWNPSAHTC